MESEKRCDRVAVFGCGYVGTAAGRQLVEDGCDVVGTTTTPGRCKELSDVGIKPVVTRVDQIETLRELLADRDVVILTVAAGRGSPLYSEVYAGGAKNIITALADTSVGRIIYTSSTRVYSQECGEWVDESSSTIAVDDASAALIVAEQILLDGGAKHGALTSVLRLGGLHGPGRDLRKRIRLAAGSTRSDGEAWVNLVDVRDVVKAIVKLTRLQHHGVLNVTDGAPEIRRTLYDRELVDQKLPAITWNTSPDAKPGKRVRNDRVCELLGISLRAALSPAF